MVDIALATYNGAEHLRCFLDSLQAQTYQNWKLLYRDDDSSDSTVDLMRTHDTLAGRLTRVVDGTGRVGAMANFSAVLSQTEANYVLLADQDDIWYPTKIDELLRTITDLEQGEPSLPALAFSDLHIVDRDVQLLYPSFVRHQGLQRLTHPTFGQALLQNAAPGCSMMINRALLTMALPIPKEAVMHDWWLMLAASCFGRVTYIPRPLLAYRQHDVNLVGATRRSYLRALGSPTTAWRNYSNRLTATERQAGAFVRRFGPAMGNRDHERALTLAGLRELPRPRRQLQAFHHGLHKGDLTRDLLFYILM